MFLTCNKCYVNLIWMTYYYNLFLKNDLMINSQATRNLLGYPDLQSWVPGGATGKKFLNHRLRQKFLFLAHCCLWNDNGWMAIRVFFDVDVIYFLSKPLKGNQEAEVVVFTLRTFLVFSWWSSNWSKSMVIHFARKKKLDFINLRKNSFMYIQQYILLVQSCAVFKF